MGSGDVWWLMKEIWPWTVGVPSLGFVLNLALFRMPYSTMNVVVCVASMLVAAAFQWIAGWGGGEFGAFGVAMNSAIVFLPAVVAMLIGANLSRLITSQLVRS